MAARRRASVWIHDTSVPKIAGSKFAAAATPRGRSSTSCRRRFPADRLLVCEVFTPSGNWSSYPPHKHDRDRPPAEVKLEEIYYYRFEHPDAYGFQRLYDGRTDQTVTVRHGDVVTVRSGYHPFVTAYGYNAYYLNVLAGTRRSMAASDDPRYAAFRAWPPPDPRLPLVAPPDPASQANLTNLASWTTLKSI